MFYALGRETAGRVEFLSYDEYDSSRVCHARALAKGTTRPTGLAVPYAKKPSLNCVSGNAGVFYHLP